MIFSIFCFKKIITCIIIAKPWNEINNEEKKIKGIFVYKKVIVVNPEVISKKERKVGTKNLLSEKIILNGVLIIVINIIVDKIFNKTNGNFSIIGINENSSFVFKYDSFWRSFWLITIVDIIWPNSTGKLYIGFKINNIKKMEIKEQNRNNLVASLYEISPLFKELIINNVLVGFPTIKLIMYKINECLFSKEYIFLKKG